MKYEVKTKLDFVCSGLSLFGYMQEKICAVIEAG